MQLIYHILQRVAQDMNLKRQNDGQSSIEHIIYGGMQYTKPEYRDRGSEGQGKGDGQPRGMNGWNGSRYIVRVHNTSHTSNSVTKGM